MPALQDDGADDPATLEIDHQPPAPRLPSAQNPLVTAPMAIDRPPAAAGGLPALAVAVNDTLRKVGARRGLKLLRQVNQIDGLDCPGCAWPDPATPRALEVCESGARAIADELGPRRAGPAFFATYSIHELAGRSDHWLNTQGRLVEPMILRAPQDGAGSHGAAVDHGYRPISWDQALALIAAALRDLDDPRQAVFYASGHSSNEAAFLLQLLARRLGSNNLAHCANLCHQASALALRSVLGVDHATVDADDLEAAEAIFCFGHNPGSNHPRMLRSLRAAKQRGAKLVAINPLREAGLTAVQDPLRPRDWRGPGTPLADLHLQVAVGADLAVIAALMKGTIEADAVDHEFVAARTTGFAELAAELAALDWADLARDAAVAEAELRQAATIYARSKATVISWGTGLTQHQHGVATIRALLSLLLLRGNVGRPGAGALPLMGHSNVVGGVRMGVAHRPSPALLEGLQPLGVDATARPGLAQPGLDVTAALEAMLAGEVKVLISLGGNLLSAAPDTERAAEALRRCRLSVHIGTKLCRSQLITGETALILPCLVRSERDPQADGAPAQLHFEDASGRPRRSVGRLPPASPQLRGEPAILAALGAALFPEDPRVDWPALAGDYDRIRALIDRVIGPPQTLALPDPAHGPAHLPDPAHGPAPLTLGPLPERRALGDDELLLTTIRSHDQHNSTIYAHGDRLRGIAGYRRLILISLADLRRLALEPYDQVDLSCEHAGRTRSAARWVAVPYDVPPGCCAAYFPEANVLVPLEQRDPESGTPASKSIVIRIRKSPPLPERKLLQRLRR